MDLTVLYEISYGMYILGANDNGRPVGCVVNTFAQITSEDPVVCISLNKNNYTYDVIRRTGKFVLNILSEETDPNLIATFGFASGKDRDKYAKFPWEMREDLPFLTQKMSGYLTCQVLSEKDMETHSVLFARLTGTSWGEKLPPMTYSYYHKVVKGKASKNAPTFQAPPPKG